MATPCQITIIEEGLDNPKRAMVLLDADGNPKSVIPLIKRTYDFIGEWNQKKCSERPGIGAPEIYNYLRGRAPNVASFLCSMNPSNITPLCSLTPEDSLAYQYHLYLANIAGGSAAENPLWEIEISNMGKIIQPRDRLEEIVKKYQA